MRHMKMDHIAHKLLSQIAHILPFFKISTLYWTDTFTRITYSRLTHSSSKKNCISQRCCQKKKNCSKIIFIQWLACSCNYLVINNKQQSWICLFIILHTCSYPTPVSFMNQLLKSYSLFSLSLSVTLPWKFLSLKPISYLTILTIPPVTSDSNDLKLSPYQWLSL